MAITDHSILSFSGICYVVDFFDEIHYHFRPLITYYVNEDGLKDSVRAVYPYGAILLGNYLSVERHGYYSARCLG